MASFRRTLSPCNARHPAAAVNVVLPSSSPTPAPPYSPSRTLFTRTASRSAPPYAKTQHPLLPVIVHLHGRLSSSRSSFRKSSYSCLLLFLAGFLLGMFPFEHFDDLGPNDLTVDFKPPHVNARLEDGSPLDFVAPRKQLIVVTPTYSRAMQGYLLNRVGQVLRLVRPPLMWIVVEMNEASVETAEILQHSGVMYRHLVSMKNLTDVNDRGVHQRNTALEHIERHKLDGIVFFADDDNIYTRELFDRLTEISSFGTWPVAMLAQGKNKAILEGPICNGTQVIGWNTNEKSKRLRRFHVDMSGFAFNSTVLWDPNRRGHHPLHPIRQLDTVKEGFQETTFIEQIVEDETQMEGVPSGCLKILNWHLHLDACKIFYPKGWSFTENLDANLPVMP